MSHPEIALYNPGPLKKYGTFLGAPDLPSCVVRFIPGNLHFPSGLQTRLIVFFDKEKYVYKNI